MKVIFIVVNVSHTCGYSQIGKNWIGKIQGQCQMKINSCVNSSFLTMYSMVCFFISAISPLSKCLSIFRQQHKTLILRKTYTVSAHPKLYNYNYICKMKSFNTFPRLGVFVFTTFMIFGKFDIEIVT